MSLFWTLNILKTVPAKAGHIVVKPSVAFWSGWLKIHSYISIVFSLPHFGPYAMMATSEKDMESQWANPAEI
jgi:hypothetical protein